MVFRLGGDEFLVLLPDQTIENAMIWAERFRQAVSTQPLTDKLFSHNITVSIGLAEQSAAIATAAGLLDAADSALYAAKRCGRNAVRGGCVLTAF
jgi:diguanylate cyclase (GGDEF)-like protein